MTFCRNLFNAMTFHERSRSWSFRISLIGLALCLCSPAFALITVNPKTQRLVDEDGRERIFHGKRRVDGLISEVFVFCVIKVLLGTNVVVKIPPYHPTTGAFDPCTSINA
jgi:hypothetical protein